MRRHLWRNRLSAITAVVAGAVTALALGGAMPAVSRCPAPAAGAVRVAPHAIGELDCNGLSPIQHSVKQGLPCLDPRGPGNSRFEESGHYIGHDEPSVRFISSQPGSGNNITFNERLPVEPAKLPTVRHPGKDVTHYVRAEPGAVVLHHGVRPEFRAAAALQGRVGRQRAAGSYPGAGAAFVELQFYPPGFAPFTDAISCDNSALVLGAEHRQPGVPGQRVGCVQRRNAPSRSTSLSCRPTACHRARPARS